MLRFDGDRRFPLPAAEVFAKLTDARFLVSCIPDLETLSEAEPDHAKLVLRPGLSFMRGSLNLTLRVVETVVPTTASVLLSTKGMGSSSTVEVDLRFVPQDQAAQVYWSAEVKELGGLLKMMPEGLIRGAAQKVINDVWAKVESNLGGN